MRINPWVFLIQNAIVQIKFSTRMCIKSITYHSSLYGNLFGARWTMTVFRIRIFMEVRKHPIYKHTATDDKQLLSLTAYVLPFAKNTCKVTSIKRIKTRCSTLSNIIIRFKTECLHRLFTYLPGVQGFTHSLTEVIFYPVTIRSLM